MKNDIGVMKKKIKIAFSGISNTIDRSLMPLSFSPECYGFTFSDGILKSKIGIAYATAKYALEGSHYHFIQALPVDHFVSDLFVYRKTNSDGSFDDRLVAQTTTGELYYTKLFESDFWFLIPNVTLTGKACSVNYNVAGDDCLLLSSPSNDLMILKGETVTTVPAAPHFSSMCVHYERIFATDSTKRNSVWFSDDFNPQNWNVSTEEGGFINFNDECGEVLKVVSFLDYVYIFRERGIFRLTAFADQTEFSLSKVFAQTGRIYADTISETADKIIFYCDDGLYAFNGFDVKKIGKDLPKIAYKKRASGTVHGDKYYLACCVESYIDGSAENNALIEYDFSTGLFSILKGAFVKKPVSVCVHHNFEIMLVMNSLYSNLRYIGKVSEDGNIFYVPTSKHWESPVNAMNDGRKKVIREVQLKCNQDITLGIITDGVKSSYPVKASELQQRIKVNKSGLEIGFTIDTAAAVCEVSQLAVIVDFV